MGKDRPKSSPNDGTAAVWGAHAHPRVVVGAPADYILPSSLFPIGLGEAAGGGACAPLNRERARLD